MSILPLGSFRESRADSWLRRVSENLRLAIRPIKLQPTSANRAPLHFESIALSARRGRGQTFPAGIHIAILLGLIFAVASAPIRGPLPRPTSLDFAKNLLAYVPPPPDSSGRPSLGSDGSGGENENKPARFGNLAPSSSMPLVPPRLNRNADSVLPAPPAVFDPNAPTSVTTVTNLGLPWMRSDTDSAGPGRGHGFGTGDGNTMGDGNGNGAGASDGDGSYANVASPVTCLYCPEPGYSEEARKAKLQVLVGPDGKATRIRILQGLGMGLDERAIEAVHTWRFSPGRDAAKNPVPAWVTIETRFQLF